MMDAKQFELLLAVLERHNKAILEKLEEIRCGLVDVEDEIIETRRQGQ